MDVSLPTYSDQSKSLHSIDETSKQSRKQDDADDHHEDHRNQTEGKHVDDASPQALCAMCIMSRAHAGCKRDTYTLCTYAWKICQGQCLG